MDVVLKTGDTKDKETSPALQAAQARVEAKTEQLRNSLKEFHE